MGVPQIIIIILYAVNLGITLAKHGESTESKYNFIGTFISTALMVGLLIWGGFFS